MLVELTYYSYKSFEHSVGLGFSIHVLKSSASQESLQWPSPPKCPCVLCNHGHFYHYHGLPYATSRIGSHGTLLHSFLIPHGP